METNDTITLKEQREMEHEVDLEMIKYYFPVEKKWNTIHKIIASISFGIALGCFFNLLAIRKNKRIKAIAKEMLKELKEEGYTLEEISNSDLEIFFNRAAKKLGY